MKKRILSLLLVVALVLSMVPAVGAAGIPFTDVSTSAWYYDSVCYVYDNGLMNGVSSTRFDPNGQLTRGMFATVLGRIEGIIVGDYPNQPFTDVNPDVYYAPYISWAHEMGVTNGVGTNRFSPNSYITREQIATMVTRFVQNLNYELIPTATTATAFNDANQISPWAREAVEYMRVTGMLQGDNYGNFNPKGLMTRCQAAQLLARLVEALNFEVVEFAFEDFHADTSDILVDVTQTVTFYAQVQNDAVLTDGEITLCTETGITLATMHDDGQGADEVADDGIFTATANLEAHSAGVQSYCAHYGNVVSPSFSISFYENLTDEQLWAGEDIMQALYDIAAQHLLCDDLQANMAEAAESLEAMCAYLQNALDNDIILSFAEESDGLHFIMPGNLVYVFTYEAMLTDPAAATRAPEEKAPSYTLDTSSDICVLKPFNWQHDDSNLENAAEEIIDTGLSYTWTSTLEDGAVTVDAMKGLDAYHIILIDSHGGTNSICTGESPTQGSLQNYAADRQAGRIRVVGVSNGGNRSFYSVTDDFFSTYYRAGDFNNSLVYVGTCHSADSPDLSSALINAGVKTVLGYSNSVYTRYCEQMCYQVVHNLCQTNAEGYYYPVSTALINAQSTLGQTDVHWATFNTGDHTAATLQIMGDNGFRLDSGFVSGDVEDAITGAPIALGSTYVNNANSTPYSDGAFGLRTTSGTHRVSVAAYGYLTRTVVNVRVNRGVTTYLSDSRLVPNTATNTSITGLITDATTGEPVPNVSIRFREYHNNNGGAYVKDSSGSPYTISTDDNGNYSTSSLPIGYYTLEASRNGYITQYADIVVGAGDYNEFSMSPTLDNDEYRVVLTWGASPRDLDSHLAAEGVHVYYADKTDVYCNLDHDDTSSYGPETITITDLGALGGFTYMVHNYTDRSASSTSASAGNMAASGAVVKLFRGSQLIKAYYVPASGMGTVWTVFSLSASGRITTHNTFSYESNPSSVGYQYTNVRGDTSKDIK